jgi:hypothetical protein
MRLPRDCRIVGPHGGAQQEITMPESRGPQHDEEKPEPNKSNQGANIDQEAQKQTQGQTGEKDRYQSPDRQGVDDRDEQSGESRGPDQRTQLGQHQDKQAYQGQKQGDDRPGQERYAGQQRDNEDNERNGDQIEKQAGQKTADKKTEADPR